MTLSLLKRVRDGAYVVLDTRTTIGFVKDCTKIEDYDRLALAFTPEQKTLWESLVKEHTKYSMLDLFWETWIPVPQRKSRIGKLDSFLRF